MIPVVMSGGSGTRLWPLSRKHKPKQFLNLFGDDSMFQQTILRLKGLDSASPIVVCNESHRFMVAEQLLEIGIESPSILLEPAGRNTAPAIVSAAFQALSREQDPVLLVLAADHVIADIEAFHQAIKVAEQQALAGNLVTFGIVPSCAHTGYGYIQAEEKETISAVKQFVEKPDLATAEQYLASGKYYWNSGMFMFKASLLIEEMNKFNPDIVEKCRLAVSQSEQDLDFVRLNKTAFEACPSDSIDYALMEKTNKAVVVPLDAGWNDVGSWSSLWECSQQDENNNVLKGDVEIQNVKNAYIHSEHRLVSAIGVEDLVIVETADAVMVASKAQAQDIKDIVAKLKSQSRPEAENHRLCYRPWGYYDSIDLGERFQVKRIRVKPGASLSLQMHHHRAEHWVVVQGTAEVTRDDEVFLLSENESTFIPVGQKHRLHNPGRVPLEIIEIQSGGYLGEDDIVRFQDNYHRN
ncbi:MAG: mannose-1-phosphate guanylyltransferase/mannose-6-phosphate isomerase [Pseudomonadota bacterium]|nr:mannose-1-phosphate guanylyltransferase/mannose-6-phosphate isomerase [Pseudomonadota bacterium]